MTAPSLAATLTLRRAPGGRRFDARTYRPNLSEVLRPGSVTFHRAGTAAHMVVSAVAQALDERQPVLVWDCNRDVDSERFWEMYDVGADGPLPQHPLFTYRCAQSARPSRTKNWPNADSRHRAFLRDASATMDALGERWGRDPLIVVDSTSQARGHEVEHWRDLRLRAGSTGLVLTA